MIGIYLFNMRAQPKTFTLSNGSKVTARQIADSIPCSISLARARLNSSNDPDYIYMPKGKRIDGGHPYYLEMIKTKEDKKKTRSVVKKHYVEGDLKAIYDPFFKLAMKVI